MKLEDAISQWRTSLCQSSRHTQVAYLQDLHQFLGFLTQHHSAAPTVASLLGLTVTDARAWLSARLSDGYHMRSTRRALAAVRQFYQFLATQGIGQTTAWEMIKSPKVPKALPKALTAVQARALLDAFGAAEGWVGLRDRALLMLLYGCGLRISEALGLQRQDFPAGDFLTITGKGSKQRQVPILPVVQQAVVAYIQACPFAHDPLFLGERGKPLQAAVVQKRLRDVRCALGLPETTTPHALRHSFATHLIQANADLRSVQTLLGHENLATTQIYTKLEAQRMLQAVQRAHPRGHLDPGA